MPKTITLRVDDYSYALLKKAADGNHRPISNFIEHAALSYLSHNSYVNDAEMSSILKDRELMASLRRGEKEIKAGAYTIVG